MREFYIENIKHQGNCRLFWAVDGNGYTCSLDLAWVVDEPTAKRICKNRPEQDIPRAVDEMVLTSVRHVPR